MSITLVLDTNAIFRLPGRILDGPILTSIKHSREPVQIIVPEIVKRELLKLFDEELDTRLRKLIEAQVDLEQLVGSKRLSDVDFRATAKAAVRYPIEFDDSLRKHEVIVAPVSAISLDAIVERAVAKRRPFSETGRGFKDALIWDTVLQHASPGTRLAVVTNDSDFIGKDGRLHNELAAEIEQRGLTQDDYSVFRSLADFTRAWIESQLGVVELGQFVETGLLNFFKIDDISPDHIAQRIRESELLDESQIGSLIGAKVLFARVTEVGENFIQQYEGQESQARWLTDTQAIVHCPAQVPSSIEIIISRDALGSLTQLKGVETLDSNWTDELSQLQVIAWLDLTLIFVFDFQQKRLITWDVANVKVPFLDPGP